MVSLILTLSHVLEQKPIYRHYTVRQAMSSSIPSDVPIKQNEWLTIAPSPIHNLGGFARKTIPAETPIAQYIGEPIAKEVSAQRLRDGNTYIFCLNDETDVDGSIPENLPRYLNHSCQPNCETRQVVDVIWIYSLQSIPVDEELTINYGYDLENYREHPCRCGSPDCVGYIVAEVFFDHVRHNAALEFHSSLSPETRE
ncbi:MAG: hypothetical protein M2R45_01044 [Verrucomicrobia subdivision 3 bacterium]|nr:hypothetical protein [Limisphaerales bacterium]MCS1414157.1 hypothetical protein [Limisphaerales bacterium]